MSNSGDGASAALPSLRGRGRGLLRGGRGAPDAVRGRGGAGGGAARGTTMGGSRGQRGGSIAVAGRAAPRGMGMRRGSANRSAVFGKAGDASSTKEPLFQPLSDSNDESGDDVAPPSVAAAASTTARASPVKKSRQAIVHNAKDELYDSGAEAARRSRFETTASENRYLELKPLREQERRQAIAAGLIPDPLKPRRLDEAIAFQGTCEEMCPEFEREEREFQKNVDKWEMAPGSNRISPYRAVKAFHRPAAGNEQPVPSDVRPPEMLEKTLDYLFHEILAQDPEMADSHPFLRDRTRAVRQDFTLQNERGISAVECHERIARYHILCLHVLREWKDFSESQELEQLRKVLQSLNEFYDDARHEGFECPDEAEFRAYYLITHLRDSDTIRQTELLSTHIFNSRYIQSALRLQSLVLRNNESRGERGRRPANSEASLNAFSRFFKAVAKDDTSYLLACLAESHFTDVRRGALVALKKAYIERNPQYPLPKLAKMLGCNNVAHCAEVVENFGLGVVYDAAGRPVSVELHRKVALQEYPSVIKQRASRSIVEVKRGSASIQDIIDGQFYSSHVDIVDVTKRISRPVPAKPAISAVPGRPGARPPLASLPAKNSPFSSPPVSVPPSPKPSAKAQFPFSFKQAATIPQPAQPHPTSSTKLNPAAFSFTPGQTNAISASTVSLAASQTLLTPGFAFTAPATVSSVASAQPQPVSPVTQRNPLQARHVTPANQQSQSPPVPQPRLTSGRTPSLSSKIFGAAQPSHAQANSAAVNVATAAEINKTVLNRAIPALLDKLLEAAIDTASRNAAIQGLQEAHSAYDAARRSERQRIVERCTAGLLEQALDRFAAEKAQYITASLVDKRTSNRAFMKRWRGELRIAQQARRVQLERKRRFSDLATHLGSSPKRQPVQDALPDLSIIDLADSSRGVEPTPARRPSTHRRRDHFQGTFWTSRTLSTCICDHVNRTFGTLHISGQADWKCLIVVQSLESPIATWYRCKLGMGTTEEEVMHVREHVRVHFTLAREQELGEEELDDVGLVVTNSQGTEAARDAMDSLRDRLAKESQYQRRWLEAIWSEARQAKISDDAVHYIDLGDVNAGLDAPISQMLASILPNESASPAKPARAVVERFVDVWRTGMLACQARAASLKDQNLHLLLLEQFLSLLREINEQMTDFVFFESGDDGLFDVPQLGQFDQAAPLSTILRDFLAKLELRKHLVLSTVLLQCGGTASDGELLGHTLQGLADCLLQAFNSASLERDITDSDVKQAMRWYGEAVDDVVSDFAAEVARRKSEAAAVAQRLKKRRISSGTGENREASPKKLRDDPETAWVPHRISSLAALMGQAKALLQK